MTKEEFKKKIDSQGKYNPITYMFLSKEGRKIFDKAIKELTKKQMKK